MGMAEDIKSRTKLGLVKKLGFGLAAFVGFILLFEMVLQLAGLIVARAEKPALKPGANIIVCMGDSHTYGVFLERDEAYPAQLGKILGRVSGSYQVINLGVPGQNSTQIKNALPEVINNYHPEILVVMVGVNNGWNIAGQEKSRFRKILNRSKLYKLGRILYFHKLEKKKSYMVVRRRDSTKIVYHQERDYEPAGDAELRAIQMNYLQDMAEIAKLCRQNRVQLVLMNYAGDKQTSYPAVNRHIRQVAEKLGLPMVDNYSYFISRLYAPDGTLDPDLHQQLFLKDMHLKPMGYAWMADNLYRELKRQGLVQ